MELDSNSHSVFLMHYHLVLVVKYRRKVFDDCISNRAKEIFEYIAPNYNITSYTKTATVATLLSEILQTSGKEIAT